MEDQAIIAMFFARDEQAILETDRKYGAYLKQVACRILRSPEDTEEIDFVLDRPFLFLLTGPDDLPLFIGIVNAP